MERNKRIWKKVLFEESTLIQILGVLFYCKKGVNYGKR